MTRLPGILISSRDISTMWTEVCESDMKSIEVPSKQPQCSIATDVPIISIQSMVSNRRPSLPLNEMLTKCGSNIWRTEYTPLLNLYLHWSGIAERENSLNTYERINQRSIHVLLSFVCHRSLSPRYAQILHIPRAISPLKSFNNKIQMSMWVWHFAGSCKSADWSKRRLETVHKCCLTMPFARKAVL